MGSPSSNRTVLLIESVRKREFLYDQDSALYRDSEKRTRAWEEIGKELSVSADEAKLTWDKLRRCFSNALNRRRQLTTRARKTWRYHRQMQFLEAHIDYKKILQPSVDDFLEVNLREDSVVDGEELEISPVDSTVVKQEPIDDMEQVLESFVETVESHGAEPQKSPRDASGNESASPKKKRRRNLSFEYVDLDATTSVQYPYRNAEITLQQPNQSQSFSPWNMDETDLFFLSMAKMTKKLTLLQQAHIKSRLSHEVLGAVIAKEEEQQKMFEYKAKPFSTIVKKS